MADVANHMSRLKPGVKYRKAQGTYLAWLDVSEPIKGMDCEKMAEKEELRSAEHYFEKWLVQNARIQLNPGSNYGTENTQGVQIGAMQPADTVQQDRIRRIEVSVLQAGDANHMRMNLGTSMPNIIEALDNMASALKNA